MSRPVRIFPHVFATLTARNDRNRDDELAVSPQQAPAFPGCCLYLDPYTWRPCSLTLREPPRAAAAAVAQGAGLAYFTSCPATTSPCSSRSPETDGTTDKTNEPGGTRVGNSQACVSKFPLMGLTRTGWNQLIPNLP